MQIAYHVEPHPYETISGDVVVVEKNENSTLVAVIDGLGHGKDANLAAEKAKQTIINNKDLPIGEIMNLCHEALRSTRGAAETIMRFMNDDSYRGEFVGIGNIALTTKSKESFHVASLPGIVGYNLRKIKKFDFVYYPGDLICLFSDGLISRLTLDDVDCSNLDRSAKMLVKTYKRGFDDAAVMLIYVN